MTANIQFCDPNMNNEHVGELENNNKFSFILHFQRCKEYNGEFGFDWMREEYIYTTKLKKIDYRTGEDIEVDVQPICLSAYHSDIIKEYNVLFEYSQKKYFIPWLSMFSNHEEKTGNKVKLQLKLEILDKKWRKTNVMFECPDGFKIIPDNLEIKNNKDIYNIEIECNKIHDGGNIAIKTIKDKKNPIEQVVGMVELHPNKEFILDLRWIPFLRKGHIEEDREFIKKSKDDIIKYLKSQSLNQAMIIPSIAEENEIIFDEVQWENNNKIITANYGESPEKVFNSTNDPMQEYKNTYEKDIRFDGLVLVLCNMNYKIGGVAGAGEYDPTQENTCVIFKEGFTKAHDDKPYYSTFSHEIGHVLGLEHTFERHLFLDTNKCNDYRAKLVTARADLESLQKEVDGVFIPEEEYWDNHAIGYDSRTQSDSASNAQVCRDNAAKVRKSRKALEINIKFYEKSIESHERLYKNTHYLFTKGSTDCIMDYFLIGSKHSRFTTFFRWQWEIMQKEVVDYYSK